MKKIMFNDKYELTEAVLSGRKTQTRRIIPQSVIEKVEKFGREYFAGTLDSLTGIDLFNHYFFTEKLGRLPFSVGEVVAIAQSYASIVDELEDPKNFCCMEHWESAAPKRAHYCDYLYHPGMLNKMFVSADEMIDKLAACFGFSEYWIKHQLTVDRTSKRNGRVVYTVPIHGDFYLYINVIQNQP